MKQFFFEFLGGVTMASILHLQAWWAEEDLPYWGSFLGYMVGVVFVLLKRERKA